MEESNGIVSLALPNAAPPDGLWPELIVRGWERPHNHAVSPDGKRVAFYLDRNGHTDLWVMDVNQPGFADQLTFDRSHTNWWEDEPPAWTPDSRQLVFGATDDNGVSNLWVVSADGSAPRALTEQSYDTVEPAISPDGRFVAFSTQRGETSQIGVVPLDGGWIIGVTSGDIECSGPSWSPDGTRIIYHAAEPHRPRQNDVYSIPFVEGYLLQMPARLTPDDTAECWNATFSPSGREIAMLCNATGYDEIWLMAPDGSSMRRLTHLNLDIEEFTWSPDGRRILCVASEQGNDRLLVIHADSGEVCRVETPVGNISGAQWVRGSTPAAGSVIMSFDSPNTPPELRLCDIGSGSFSTLARFSAPALRHYDWAQPRRVTHLGAEGWEIPAMLFTPTSAPTDSRGAPAIVYPHGGPNADYGFMWDPIRQYFVAKGYVVICPNFRGSTGYGRQFREGNLHKWGVADLEDCLCAADFVAALPGVDRERIAIWGQSYGGYLATLAVAKDPRHRFRCAVSLYGDSSLLTSWARGDHSGRQDVEWQMGHPGRNRAGYELGSPINFVNNIRAPMLILHGERDARVHADESRQLVAALRRSDKTFEFKTYEDEAHGFAHAHNALDALARIERFLDWHLM